MIRPDDGCSSETSVNFYQTRRRNNPEDSHLFTRRRENLKYHNIKIISKKRLLKMLIGLN
jgi:hypothetical protein